MYQASGWIEVIVGGMYSGKTEELIRRLRRAEFARQPLQVFKPKIDSRYHAEYVTSHNQNSFPSQVIEKSHEILDLLRPETKIVGIDEGQFFDQELVNVVQILASRGLRVIIAGLDTDWKGQGFEPIPTLMAIAENVTKQQAVCVVCGGQACRTQRVAEKSAAASQDRVLVGSHGHYEARCREHFRPEVIEPWQNHQTLSTSDPNQVHRSQSKI
jgi:thymidine kinase